MSRLWLAVPVLALAAAAVGWLHPEMWLHSERWLHPDLSLHSERQSESLAAAASARADLLRRAATAPPVPRGFYGRRLEPRDSVVLHGAGQSDETSFASYTKAVAPARPMLSMSYLDLRENIPGYFARIRAELARYPELIVPQIGLSLNAGEAGKHYEAEVARGGEDARLRLLCEGLRSLDRPAFLRIGYEFNGPWNGYSPAPYIAAFRHVTETVRGCGLENIAVVWDWSAGAELDAESGGAEPGGAARRYMAYYPGDAWVDWWALNVFGAANLWSQATTTFLTDAERHRMPVMIAESTPKGHSVSEGARLIEAWYAPYFGLIRSLPGVKAFCYIDWDWSVYPQWADWGNGRVQDNPEVLGFYRHEVAQPLYAHSRSRAETMRLLRTR